MIRRSASGSWSRRIKVRSAFTLVELMVAVALLALLAGLMLPALLAARDASRQVRCSNNLRQLGLALHQFEAARRFLPPSGLAGKSLTPAHRALGVPAGPEHGWIVFLLPYLEQQSLYDRYQLAFDWRAPENLAVREQSLPGLLCPASPNPFRLDSASTGGFSWRAAPTDYGAVSSVATSLYALGLLDVSTYQSPEGLLRLNELSSSADMHDGASHQLLVAEDAGRPQKYLTRARQLVSGRTTGAGWADRDNDFQVHGASHDGQSSPGPCALNCTNSNEIYAFHSGGASGLFGDASVRFISQNVGMRTLAAAISRSGRETVDAP